LGFEVPDLEPTNGSLVNPSILLPAAPRKQRRLKFASLAEFDDARLATLVKAAQTDVLVLALAGANATFVERVANCLTARQGRLLRRALKHLGPTRLSDVEEAQDSLADLAVELFAQQAESSSPKRAVALVG
jgi:flagellar motor switch protein FliG